MYCQQCGAEVGGARFCRRCGAPSHTDALALEQQQAAPDYEKGLKKLFMGLAFLAIAIFPIFTRGGFWWWMLFPAVPLLAAGVGELMRGRQAARALPPRRVATLSAEPQQVGPANYNQWPRSRNTSELTPPPASVTEGTTRLLDKEPAPRE